jgi:tRNA (guanine-N7-)-methyltransferase
MGYDGYIHNCLERSECETKDSPDQTAMVRPTDIRPPFPKSSPCVMIHDRVWYMSPLADPTLFQFPGWHSDLMFSTPGQICIEYCSGNGTWIAEKARLHPEKNWLAVEKRFDRARKIWSKIQNLHLSNLIVAFAEGLSISTTYIPSCSVAEIYVNFPDPWPKHRHAKHRIISPVFLQEAARVLQPGGQLVFVTDDEPYSSQFLQIVAEQTALMQTLGPPGYAAPPDDYGTSFFDSLFRSQGKPVLYHTLAKPPSEEATTHTNNGSHMSLDESSLV